MRHNADHEEDVGGITSEDSQIHQGQRQLEQIDSNTFEMVSAGLHWSLRISRQMPPFAFMLQW